MEMISSRCERQIHLRMPSKRLEYGAQRCLRAPAPQASHRVEPRLVLAARRRLSHARTLRENPSVDQSQARVRRSELNCRQPLRVATLWPTRCTYRHGRKPSGAGGLSEGPNGAASVILVD